MYTSKFKTMIIVSSREFRKNQKKYLDLVDNNERVVILRGNDKAYELTKEIKEDRFFDDPEIKKRLAKSIQSYMKGKTLKVTDDQLRAFFGQ